MPPEESETLIGRIIDHEATPRDMRRFEKLARDEPGLWRKLALDQVDMGLLAGRVREETAAADAVDVAAPPSRGQVALAFSGWAAVLVLGVWWALVAGSGGRTIHDTMPRLDRADATASRPDLGPEEHLKAYFAADFVRGEMDPVITETEPLEAGRHRVWFIRRIEEFVDINTPLDAVIDDGKFTVDPATLRP